MSLVMAIDPSDANAIRELLAAEFSNATVTMDDPGTLGAVVYEIHATGGHVTTLRVSWELFSEGQQETERRVRQAFSHLRSGQSGLLSADGTLIPDG